MDSFHAFMKELPKLDATIYLNSIYDFVMSNKIIESFNGEKVYAKILHDIDTFIGGLSKV